MKKLLAIVMTFAIAFGICSLAFASEDGFITTVDSVTDVPEGWTAIRTAEDLNNIRNDLAGKYIMMNDIDLSVYDNWSPIGDATTPFTGILDGNGYTIENMRINLSYEDTSICDAGLFGNVKSSTLKNIIITSCDISLEYTGTESVKCRVGAVSGYVSRPSVSNCAVSGKISVKGFSGMDVGGIAGKVSTTTLTNCLSNIDVSITSSEPLSEANIGGIAGNSSATIKKCCNYGEIKIIGEESSNDAVIRTGGIFAKGNESTSAENCYNRGDITLTVATTETYAGGIAGVATTIKNSYNSGEINLPESFEGYAGAIAGNISTDVAFIAEVVFLKDVFYNNEDIVSAYNNKTAPDTSDESYNEIYNNVSFLSEDKMKSQDSFVNFDFETVWKMEEDRYPILLDQPVIVSKVTAETTTQLIESTTEEKTTAAVTEEVTTEPATQETTTEATTVTNVETTQPTTEESTTENTVETTTEKVENTTEEATEAVTEPNNNNASQECWLVRLVKQIIAFIKNIAIQISENIETIF